MTAEGPRVVTFYTKLRHRLLSPLLEAIQPPAPIERRRALAIDRSLRNYVTNADSGPPPENIS